MGRATARVIASEPNGVGSESEYEGGSLSVNAVPEWGESNIKLRFDCEGLAGVKWVH